jgi:hypothetical protein
VFVVFWIDYHVEGEGGGESVVVEPFEERRKVGLLGHSIKCFEHVAFYFFANMDGMHEGIEDFSDVRGSRLRLNQTDEAFLCDIAKLCECVLFEGGGGGGGGFRF